MNEKEKAELEKDKGLYADLVFAAEDLNGFVSEKALARRTYIRGLPLLKEVTDLAKTLEEETSGGLFSKLHGAGKDTERRLLAAMAEGRRTFTQMDACRGCACFKCPLECEMQGCDRCEPGCGCYIAACDNKTATVYRFADKTVPLVENRTGITRDYPVIALIFDKKYDQYYLIFEDGAEKLVLYYYPSPAGDTYGEITDNDDLNFAIRTFENGPGAAE